MFRNLNEMQYIKLVRNVLRYGQIEKGRNGNTYSIFGSAMHFSLEDNKIPILTTKKVGLKKKLK